MFCVECDGVSGSTASGNRHFHLCPHQAYDGPQSSRFSVLPGGDFYSSIFNMLCCYRPTLLGMQIQPPQHQPPFLLPHLLSSSSSSSPWDYRCVQSSYPSCFSLPLFSLCIFLQTFMLCGSNAVTLRDLSPCRTGVDTPGQLGFHTTGCSVQTFRNNAAPVYTAASSSPCSN